MSPGQAYPKPSTTPQKVQGNSMEQSGMLREETWDGQCYLVFLSWPGLQLAFSFPVPEQGRKVK